MKVEFESHGIHYRGILVGLHAAANGDVLAVIRVDGMGLYLEVIHPSKVKPIED